jgi:uncharacterized protein
MAELAVFAIITLSVGMQAVAGFGSALIAMALLTPLFGLAVATPLFAAIAVVANLVLAWRYRHDLSWRAVWRIVLGSLVGIPIGVALVEVVDPQIMMVALGLVILAYVAHQVWTPDAPMLRSPAWGVLVGVLGGALGGAFNTGGPPSVMYGTNQRWSPAQFKGNLQAIFISGTLAVLLAHVLAGNITAQVVHLWVYGVAGAVLGVLAGSALDHYIDAERFRWIVLVMLFVLGLSLVF